MFEKIMQTIIDASVALTVILGVMALFNIVEWYSVFIPLPFAFVLTVVIRLGAGVYARFK